jgi:hypothetical protein
MQRVPKEGLRAAIEADGAAVVPGVVSHAECDRLLGLMWEFLEHITQAWEKPINRDDVTSYRGIYDLYVKHGMLFQHYGVGQSQISWDVRQNPDVADVYAFFYGCSREALVTSMDGLSFGLPPELTRRGWQSTKDGVPKLWDHTDQSYEKEGFKCLQGLVACLPSEEGDGTFTYLQGSHRFHGEFAKTFGKEGKKDWCLLNEEELAWYLERCPRVNAILEKGDMLLWDSRTIHCGKGPDKGRKNANTRLVVYVCMMPMDEVVPKKRKAEALESVKAYVKENKRSTVQHQKALDAFKAKRRNAVEELRTTTHWPYPKLFPQHPHTYGKPIPEVTPIEPPVLTPLGRILARID